jgi:N12 class adenine-specific DNA methylase
VDDLEKYVLLRTFSHEFTHFIENWNPIQYNEFRKAVFDAMTERDVDVDSLIQKTMGELNLDYDAASREVVAQAMTDMLQDANFVELLAQKHKTIFTKLLEKLKEFVQNIRDYFDSVTLNDAMEANALKEQGKYLDSIVKLWDEIAVQAVENYQKTVATEEVAVSKKESTTTVSETESVATTEATTEVEKDAYGFTISDNAEHGSLEISFDSKPSDEVRHALKEHKFRWHKVKKVWFGFTDRRTITDALHAAYEAEAKPADTVTEEPETVSKPAESVTETPENAKDQYDEISTALQNANVFYKGGYEFRVDLVGGAGYNGTIKRHSDRYVSNARDTIFSSMFATRQEAVADLAGVARNNKLLEEKAAETPKLKKEVTDNGENFDNQGAVPAAEPDGRGAARLLDEVEAGDVPGDGGSGDAVADAGERGQPTVRDGGEPDHGAGDVGGHGEGSGQSGDLRGTDRVTESATDNSVGDKTTPTAKDTNVPSKEAEKLHEEVVEQIAQQSTEQPKGRNFMIGDSLDLPSGEKARYKANVEAIRLVKQLEAEGRYATEAEQTILSKYVGWGGLANAFDQRKAEWAKEFAELKELLTEEEYASARGSTLNAYYTDISVIKAMYDGLKGLGFTGGRMLEPSAGVGNFVGAMPVDMASQVRSWTMVELDGITGLIGKYLYPNADMRIQGFEKANIPNNFMDVAIGNVPFNNYAIADKHYPKKVTSAIHNYFFAKSLDKVRPGGIVMFITSSYTMNSSDSTVRRYIMQKADLLGAIRLPDTAFKGNAGTEVVTDILVLKKRADNTNYAGEDFLEAPYTRPVAGNWSGAYINDYFNNHPEMVLGTASFTGGMYRGDNLTYKALEGKGSLADQIREAFRNIQGKMDYPAQKSPEKTNFAVERAGKKTKENGLVVKEGKVYKNTGGELIEQKVAKGVAERISGMLEIRDAAKALQAYQQQGLKDTEIKKARQKLNKVYDDFVKKYGFINAQTNRSAIKDDPDSFSILALENWNPDTKKATKADIFSKDTIAPNRTVTSAKDVAEGLIVSINQTGGVDAALIGKLTGKTADEVTRELIDSRAVFKNRDGGLETAEVYLSGNVRAKLRDAEALVSLDADYQKNVEALKAIVPEDVGYQDIFVNPGTVWIPDSVYSDFAAHMLGSRNTDWSKTVEVTRNKDTGNFTVELKQKYLKTNAYNTQKWGTSRRSFLDLFDAMLNSRSVVVKYKTDDGKSVVDKDATAAANEKIENIQKEFQEWLWKDENRRNELATLYNETFNSIVTPKYNGDNLTVNGANAMKPLRPHQRNAVQRIIASGGNTLLAHKVGAGKTYEMAAAAMKLKQLGLVKKPMFAVPKSLVAQWGNEFMDFFPTAKLLVAEASDFTAANRKIFANRIANGDYDAVIVSYEQFEKLPISNDFARDLYQEQIDSVIRAIEEAKAEKGGKSLSVKDLEKKRKQLQTKIEKLTDSAKDEDNIEFEQLGVDSIFVDEAHNFKNLFYTTSMTNVSGLGNKDGSKRAFDLYTKVRYLQKLNGGRGIVFATATPVMNSMSEMYIMQKYLQPDLLDQLGLSTFDAWAKQFGEVVNGVEIKPSGQGYRVKQSFSRFKNMSELQLLFRNFADVLTDIPGLKIPKMKGGKVNVVVCEPGQFQQDYMKELEQRADNIKNVDPSVDNMLKITSDGRKISYTQRMIDPSLPYEEGCKIFRCADNVLEKYQESKADKGTQIIFCDMATPKGKSNTATAETEEMETDMESAKLYDDIKARLVKGGIPGKEIAFIHEADTDAKKKKLFADVNDGKVRVLIGSTGKMGVGMNAQKRIVAIHHLDAPWRPGDVEQRNGRAYRQGNINEEVENFTYVTEGSFDARLWDILERKQNFINQVMNGENVGRETEDTGEVTLSAAEVKALASGSPLIMEQVQLDTDIKKLESLYRAHRSAVAQAKQKLEADKGTIATLQKRIATGKKDVAARVDTYSEGKFSITIGKQQYTDKKEAGIALMAEATAKANDAGYTTIGKFAGFELRVVKTHEGIKGLISGNQGYSFNTYPGNTTFGINHLIAKVESMSETVSAWEQSLEQTKIDMAEQEKLMVQPFAKQAELDQKRARYNEVMEILNPKEEQALDSMEEDAVQYQRRKSVYVNISQQEWKQIQEDRMSKYGGDFENMPTIDYIYAHDLLYVIENFDETHFGVYERIDPAKNKAKADIMVEAFKNEPVQDVRDLSGRIARLRNFQKLRSVYRSSSRNAGASAGNGGLDSGSGGTADGSRVPGTGSDDQVQHQQRTNTLSNREVLELAASELQDADLSAAEKDALNIFTGRLAKLGALQEERKQQGELYRQQQFGTKVDREAAKQTLNRMKVLDGQIEKAKADVLSIEDKQVLKAVLQKARKVVEKQQWTKDQETLKRYRERRNDAAAIKKYRERLTKDVNDLTNWVLHPNNKDVVKHIPDVLKSSVIPFLSSIDFTSKQQLRGRDATKADQEFMKRLNGLKAALKPNASTDGLYADYSDLPPNFMERLQDLIDGAQAIVEKHSGEFVVNQMTSQELKELSQVVRTLKQYIQNFNKFHANAMFQHVSDAGDNSIEELALMKNASEHTGTVSNFVLWQQMRPAYAFERFGNGGKAIYDGLRRGQAKLAFNTKTIQEFAEKAYTEAEVRAWEKEIKSVKLGGDIVKMPVSTIMSFYELSKRPQALGHILGQGIRVATYKANGKKISDAGHRVGPGDVATIIGMLTDRQKEVADRLQHFMQDQGGKWGNYVSVKRFGEELFGEENYFPINSDGRHLAANADEHPSAASLYALLNMGFTKATTEGANNRLVLYSIFDVFANHMASMAQYNAFALPVVDAIKWFNYQQKSEPDEDGHRFVVGSVRDQMDRVYGVPEETRPGSGRQGYAQTFVINILKAFNGTEAQGVPTDATGMNALRQYNMAQVAFNLRVIVQQPLAITRAALLVDYGSILKGMKLKPSEIRKNIQEMQHHSGIAAWKGLGFYDVNISRGLTDIIKHNATALDKINEVGMWGAEKADLMTWAGIWSACKEEVIRKQKLTPKSEGFYEAVTQLFEDVIYKTQVVDSVLTKNEYMRSKGFFARATGSFMSEPTTTASMLIDAYDKFHSDMQKGMTRQQAWKKNSKMIVRTAYVYGVSAALLAAVQAVADSFRDDDDYQEWYEKWLEAFGGNLVDEVMPLNKLPLLSDFYDVAKELLSVFGVDTYGNPPQSVFMQWYDSLVKGTQILYDKIKGVDTNYTWYGGAYKLLQAASGMTGLPMAAATREIVTAWNNTVGAIVPSLKVKTYEAGEKNEIKYAYQDGYLTAEEAAQQLIQQGLVDNEDEAYWTVQGWEAGTGYSRYDAILDAVRNGGDFDGAMQELTSHGVEEKAVLSRIKSQVGQWYQNREITKQQTIDMLTKYTDMSGEDITDTVNKWSSKVVTGISYDDIADELLAGNITGARAKEMYIRYGGMTEEKAHEKVYALEFQKAHPDCDGISYAAVEKYETYCEEKGVEAKVFYDVWKHKNADGVLKAEAMEYIHTLGLSKAQKNSLYYAMGWAKSELYKAPWH